MKAISIENQDDQYLIRIDKGMVEQEVLIALLNSLRVEELSKHADIGEDIEQLGEQIKADWWSRHKDQWIKDDV